MKRILTSSALTALTFASAPALAETSFGNGFTVDGHIGLQYIDLGGGSDGTTLLDTDTNLSWTSGTFGVDLNVIGFVNDEGDDASALFGGLTYSFGDSKITVGAPRAAYDAYGDFKLAEMSTFVGVIPFINGKSLLTDALLYTDDVRVYGLRYDGAFGNGKVAASYHQDDDGNAELFSSSAAFDLGQGMISGGLEYADVGASDPFTQVKLRYDGRFDQFGFGVGVISASTGGTSEQFYELSGSYMPSDKLSFDAVAMFNSEGSDSAIYGLGASYDFAPGVSARAAVLSDDSFSDPAFEIGVRYTF